MKSVLLSTITLLSCFGFGILKLNAQTTSTSSSLVAQPIPDQTVLFNYSGTGVSKPVTFGLDLAWLSEGNIRRGIAFMGKPQVRIIRSSFQPTDSLANGELSTNQLNTLNERIRIINTWVGPTQIAMNDDNPSVSSWYKNADGTFNATRWAQMIDVYARHYQDSGHTVVTAGAFNEPDYPTGQGNIQDFYNIDTALKALPRFANIRLSGGNTLNCDQALPWYNFLKPTLDEGNTHQLAGSFDNFASFYQTVRADGKHATGDELHNVVEAMVGAEYGMQTGVWWGAAELARGEFVKASDGVRLGYAEHRPNWTAASVYRAPDGKVQAFGGTSERQAVTTTYRFLSKDKDVFYDGYGPMREYSMVMPGGTGYGQGQTNAERVVNITWGEDIQPVINGRYVLVNRSSGKVVEVGGGGTSDGDNIQQGIKNGATYQQWDVTPVPTTVGGDFSYFYINNVNSGKAMDNYGFSLDDGGNIAQWTANRAVFQGINQQWFLQYAGDGWFYIRNRNSSKCIEVAMDGVNVDQWEVNGGNNQQWRLLPVDAAVEFTAPGAPNNLVAKAQATSVRLDWTASAAADVAGYTIFRKESTGGSYNTLARGVTTTSFMDNSATAGVQYFYKIKAVDKSLNRSDYSNEVSGTPTGVHDTVALYHFDGNLADSSKNLNHSAAYGGVSFSAGTVGAKALTLNGSDAFIQLPSTIANHQEITIAAWVNWKGGGNWQRIFDFGNSTTENMFLTSNNWSGNLQFSITNAGVSKDVYGPALPKNTWSHVAITLGATGLRMYVNGQKVAENTSSTISPLDFKPILNYIGRSQYPDPLLNGSLDEFQIYNYALSDSEIQAIIGQSPSSVTGTKIASGDGKVTLRWDGRFDATFNLSRSESLNGSYTSLATGLSTTQYVDAGLTNGKNYFYKLSVTTSSATGTETLLMGTPQAGQHVYLPFNDANGISEDVWGAQDATLASTATFGDGYNSAHALKLDGSANAYATLPAGVVSTLNDFTISAWINPTAVDWWMRVFDFGKGTNNYMFLTLQAGWQGYQYTTIRYAIKNGGGEQQVNHDNTYIPWNAWSHLAVIQSGNTVSVYVNGTLIASNTGITIKPSDLGITTQNYLGKSQYNDPMLRASIDEFKIYNRALNATELAQAMQAEKPIDLAATANQPKCFGDKGSVNFSTNGGTGSVNFGSTPTTDLAAGDYTYIATDANSTADTQTVHVNAPPPAVKATLLANTPDNTLYFGYSGDQSETINVTPSGGVAPYAVQISLSRPLKCNQVNDAGDEVWAGGSGGATINNTCPLYPGSATLAPVSTKTISSGAYGVTVTLMADAYVIATITDANGCTCKDSTLIHAQDVRCYSSNGGNTKVAICHKSGNSQQPCVNMCINPDDVNEHLAHGDILGTSTSLSATSAAMLSEVQPAGLEVKVMNNPSFRNSPFKLQVVSNKEEAISLQIVDGSGRKIETITNLHNGQTIEIGQSYTQGMYFVEVMQGSQRKMAKIVKQ